MPLRSHEVYLVVYVTDPGLDTDEPDVRTSRHERRFEFRGEGASDRAFECYTSALKAGLKARAEKVRAYDKVAARV
jgi:hypothetical protein